MKTFVLLALLILTSNSFGQSVWRELSTPCKDVFQIKGFSNEQINLYSGNNKQKFYGSYTSTDTIAFSYDGGKTWNIIKELVSYSHEFFDENRITKFGFVDTNKWFICGYYADLHMNLSSPWFSVYYNSMPDTSIQELFTLSYGGGASTMLFVNDTATYLLLSDRYYPPSPLFRWDVKSTQWDTVINLGNDRSIASINVNNTNGDFMFFSGDQTYNPKELFFRDNVTGMIVKRDTSALNIFFSTQFSPVITHIVDSQWYSTKSKYYSKTTDNGLTWMQIDSVDGEIIATTLNASGYGFAATNVPGVGSSIYKTTDFGTTWTKQISGILPVIRDISITDSLTAYFTNGKLYKTTDGGGSILLSTNDDNAKVSVTGITIYPNPVNNNTCQLQYPKELSSKAITVYDMLGRRILYTSTSIGSERTSLDLTPFPSGVYYVAMGKERLKLIKN